MPAIMILVYEAKGAASLSMKAVKAANARAMKAIQRV